MRSLTFSVLFLFTGLASAGAQDTSMAWRDAQKARKGTVTIHWFANNPFCFKDASGAMKGIEVEIMQGFQQYVKKHHQVDLTFRWVEEHTFTEVLSLIKNKPAAGTFGLAGFSFSDARRS